MWTSAPGGTMDVASTRSPPITLAMSASTVVVVCTFIGDTADICVVLLDSAGVDVTGPGVAAVSHATASNNSMNADSKANQVRDKLAFI